MYELNEQDFSLLRLVQRIFTTAMQLPAIPWSQKASVAKMLHVITRMPRVTCAEYFSVGFTGPRVVYGEARIYFHLTASVENELVLFSYGGHYFHPSTGGDSFTVFRWSAVPGCAAEFDDFRESLGVVTNLVDPYGVLRGMHDNLAGYKIDLVDDENPLLQEEESEGVADEDAADDAARDGDDAVVEDDSRGDAEVDDRTSVNGLVVRPITRDDAALLATIGVKLYTKSAGSAHGVEQCDACGVQLATRGLFVDGDSGRNGWGNYCSTCALMLRVEVGLGKGQLYAQQPDGTWSGVAGFRP